MLLKFCFNQAFLSPQDLKAGKSSKPVAAPLRGCLRDHGGTKPDGNDSNSAVPGVVWLKNDLQYSESMGLFKMNCSLEQ